MVFPPDLLPNLDYLIQISPIKHKPWVLAFLD
jgi:hypothetical protein